MQGNEARELLGFPPNSRPTPSQVKAAYKRKAWESHPDRFLAHEKFCAESKFKLISEAYSFLQAACQMIEEMAPLRSKGFVDPGWQHGIAQDHRKKKVKCSYCGKIVSGGIYRLKQHLARMSGEVTHCKSVPEDVYLKMKENLEGCRSSKRQRKSEYGNQAYLSLHSNDDDEEEEEPVHYKYKGKQVIGDASMVMSVPPLRSLGYVDPGWEHGVAQDQRKKKVKCNYCERIVSGGINRFKQHLARIPGEVAPCNKAPEEVYLKIKENMKWHRAGSRNRLPEAKELAALYFHSDNEYGEEQGGDHVHDRSKEKLVTEDNSLSKETRKRFRGRPRRSGTEPHLTNSRLHSVIERMPKNRTPRTYKQVKAKAGSDKKSHKEAISAICKFFYHAAIPSNAANSPYFHKMLELVGRYGQGLKGPSSQLISGQFLLDEIATLKEHLVELKASWVITGCTIMTDSWTDAECRTLINFLVSCPRGVYFISSVDATDIVDDAENLFKLLDKVVEEIGEENVVQVITENTANYRAAGKMLEEKRRNLFWTPCAAYCTDRMLEDFLKIKWVGECMDKGKKVTKFIYNCAWLLDLMKNNFTEGRELLKPALTRIASSFVTLQSLLDHRTGLKRMFQSNNWLSSRFAKLEEGNEVEKIVLNSTFWKKMHYVRKSVDPILQVLLKVDSDEGLSMASIYNDLYRAKLAIKTIHGDDMRKYGPFWTVIDNHWNSLLHHPLYVSAYFLNPSYRYRPDFLVHPEVIRGLNECIVRLEPDNGRRISVSMQISDFVSARADFGTDLAVSKRTELDPAAWWEQHGINCLELQRIAIRILSQTCSSFGCEHNWSTYDQIYRKRRNRLAQKRLNDLIYVHYNLHLKERPLRRKADGFISIDSALLDGILDDWIVETEKQAMQEDEEILYNEMEQSEAGENEVNENEDRNAEAKKGLLEMLKLAGVVEPLEVHPASVIPAAADDDDLDLLDDDLTD